MTGIEALSNAGNDGGILSRIAGAPVRMVGGTLEGGLNVWSNRKTRGILGSAVDAGLIIPKAVGKEVLFTPIGVAGKILSNTRDAAMNILKPMGGIAMHGLAQAIRVPTGVDIRDARPGRLNEIVSRIDGGSSLGTAISGTTRASLERASNPGSGPGTSPRNPNPEPGPTGSPSVAA